MRAMSAIVKKTVPERTNCFVTDVSPAKGQPKPSLRVRSLKLNATVTAYMYGTFFRRHSLHPTIKSSAA